MKIGIIGLGNIAQKAYLPIILNKKEVTPVLCTRNLSTLNSLAANYRVRETAASVEDLISSGIEAAFIHSSTESHFSLAEKLLRHDIAVFVDKPLSYHFEKAEELVALAEERGVCLFTGFNRRFAPMYSALKGPSMPGITIMQKNRLLLPDETRKFIFDDFIHVVDTIRFLSPELSKDISVQYYKKSGNLMHLTVQFSSENYTAIGIMNHESGKTEEVLEVMKDGQKHIITDLNSKVLLSNGEERHIKFNDWETVLLRRGFVEMIRHFLEVAKKKEVSRIPERDSLLTHWYCEEIVRQIGQ
ncbi:MAG: Gfo/Idh/MocA family oxidoreductase [Ignavibacteria bacterium]|jgi:virulence factor|nr:Gfo/Idh/MocA family oxidoreductase [Ignavibacteria bacterium]MCU7501774.1 Gfo/Idh/MocA family oxidoreductase [Ignavibacteria bacterium]MCU7516819.1 Gfo/Idh/MocA family oxidoreductase [Ignavibacteria bacterium]